jgi:hypothetical protein
MDKLKKIVSDRVWNHKSLPLATFEEHLMEMFDLEIFVISSKASEAIKNEVRKQYLIMLVTCYETYIREKFQALIDKKLISSSDLIKIKKLKEVKFTIEEIEFIKDKDIKLSELACSSINFQNFGEMMNAYSVIQLDKRIDEKVGQKDGVVPPPDLPKLLSFKSGAEGLSDFYKQFVIHIGFPKLQLYQELNLLLAARHKIIHDNIEIKITQDDINMLTAAVYDFIMLLESIIHELEEARDINSKIPSKE